MHTPRTHPPNLRTHTPARRQQSFISDPESMRTTVQFTPSPRLKPPFQYDWAKPYCGIPIKFYELLTACGSCAPALPGIPPPAEACSLRRPWQSPGSGACRMMTAVTSRPPFRCREAPVSTEPITAAAGQIHHPAVNRRPAPVTPSNRRSDIATGYPQPCHRFRLRGTKGDHL